MDVHVDILAWHAAIVIAPWSKKKITPHELRGKKPSEKPGSGKELLDTLRSENDQFEIDEFWKKGKGKTWL